MKDAAGVETVITGAEDLTLAEYMKGKEAKGRNGIKNKAKEGKHQPGVTTRGYN